MLITVFLNFSCATGKSWVQHKFQFCMCDMQLSYRKSHPSKVIKCQYII